MKRRGLTAAWLLAALVLLTMPAGALSARGGTRTAQASLDAGVLDQLNAIRLAHGLVALTASPRLAAAAAQHTREMAADGYFAHNSVNGTAFWRRISHWYSSAQFGYWSVGENLLWSSPDVDAAGALRLWMQSPEHRANILAPRWREIGIANVHVANAAGVYGSRPVTIVATDFGVRKAE
ncbi:MAG TPA: CAP domain-containing protein [Galbitalea sp.]